MESVDTFVSILEPTLITVTSVTNYTPNKEAIASAVARREPLFAYLNNGEDSVTLAARNNSDNRIFYSLGNRYNITALDVRTRPLQVIFSSDKGVSVTREF